jgi:hypothetical protein
MLELLAMFSQERTAWVAILLYMLVSHQASAQESVRPSLAGERIAALLASH